MKILAASVTNKDVAILEPHIESVRALRLPDGVTLDVSYISDDLREDALELLASHDVEVAEALPKPEGARYAVTEKTHDWSMPTFEWLAREKQRLLDYARTEGYDGIFFVDSDLVLGPDTLASLLASEKELVSAVFWTRWQPDSPELPQVWMRHPYELSGKGVTQEELLAELQCKSLVEVGGLGACTLFRSSVFDRVAWFPLVPGLPMHGMWQGEDRHFCVRAARNHVPLWADAWPEIFHIYRPSDLARLREWKPRTQVEKPEFGDWVSLILEPVEEKGLYGTKHPVRGRLGALPLEEELERAVFDMSVGEARVVQVEFGAHHEIPEYRGTRKHILVRLVDAKR